MWLGSSNEGVETETDLVPFHLCAALCNTYSLYKSSPTLLCLLGGFGILMVSIKMAAIAGKAFSVSNGTIGKFEGTLKKTTE